MEIERIDAETTYLEETATGFPTVTSDGGAYTVDPGALQPLETIQQTAAGVDPETVAATLGLETSQFDGDPIYHGSIPGTELQWQPHETGTTPALLLVSFGESQPGRYACTLEAVVRP